MKRCIYADYNATTPPGSAAIAAMSRAAAECWGNPSSTHRLGRQAREQIDGARAAVAAAAGAMPSEVVFTSGGSEASSLALLGSRLLSDEFRLLTSEVEHSSVLDAGRFLAARNATVQYVRLLPTGELDLERFVAQLDRFRPSLVSLMAANNETGVLFPIPEVAAHCAARDILLHVDAVQALGKVSAPEWNAADFVSVSAHKIYGPKGVGALLVRRGRKLVATHFGGSQETKRRGGTENVPGIAGFGAASGELPPPDAVRESTEALRDRFEARVTAELEGSSVNGSRARRLPNTTSLRVAGIPAELLLGALDLDGVCVSAGSACSSGSLSPSHVLVAMGLSAEAARECLRISWGRGSTVDEVDTVAGLVIHHVSRIRSRKR